jgi:hypothetical protein
MFIDVKFHLKQFDVCQSYARNDLHLNLPLNLSPFLVPFEKWGINYIGTIHLNSSRGMQYIIVVTEYLTKWVEVKVIKSINAKQIVIFFNENIISQFGCSKILINDGGSHLLNDVIVD